MSPAAPPKASQYSISEKDHEWMDSKLMAQPNSITDNAIELTGALQKVAKKTFIRAPKYPQARSTERTRNARPIRQGLPMLPKTRTTT